MEVLMGIHMIELQPRGGKGSELRLDFGAKLGPDFGKEKHRGTRPHHVGAKVTGPIHQVRHAGGGQNRFSFHQNQMKAHAQFGHGLGTGNSILGG